MHTSKEKHSGSSNERERRLLQGIADRDREALREFYELYHPRVFKFVFRLTNSYSAADELTNDIMVVVWNKADTFRGDSRVSTWVFGVAYRQTMRRLSRKKLPVVSSVDPDRLHADQDGSLEHEDWVRQAMQGLPDAQRMAVLLVFYLGMSYEEVAAVTDCPVNTVKTRMFHARKKLKSLLSATATPGNTLSGR